MNVYYYYAHKVSNVPSFRFKVTWLRKRCRCSERAGLCRDSRSARVVTLLTTRKPELTMLLHRESNPLHIVYQRCWCYSMRFIHGCMFMHWVSLVKSFRKDGSFACLRSMLCDSKTPRWPACRISYFLRNEFRGISIWCSLKYSSFFLSFVCILYESISELNVKRPSAKNRQLASVSSWRWTEREWRRPEEGPHTTTL